MRSGVFSLCAVILVLAAHAPADAQILRGRVIDDDNEQPIRDAAVTVLLSDGKVGGYGLANEEGRFAIRVSRPDWIRVHVTRIGFKDVLTARVDLTSQDTMAIELRLSVRAVLLAPIEVIAQPRTSNSAVMAQVNERMQFMKKLGLGTFFTREVIQDNSMTPIAQFIASSTAGVRLNGDNIVMRAASTLAGGECSPQWYLNGMPIRLEPRETIDMIVSMADLEVIEVYKGASQLPAEYSGSTGGCGAVGLWTRRH